MVPKALDYFHSNMKPMENANLRKIFACQQNVNYARCTLYTGIWAVSTVQFIR